MARKHKHEDHANHEAWAIPYGDLVTLLLALFVVMYAVSSINEGKFRVLSDAMAIAFGGAPHTLRPIQFGESKNTGSEHKPETTMLPNPLQNPSFGILRQLHNREALPGIVKTNLQQHDNNLSGNTGYADGQKNLRRIAAEVQAAMQELIKQGMIVVRPGETWLEVEIKTDILFSSGSAVVSSAAQPVLQKLVEILKPFPNVMRIEGHTDNIPINTRVFPSNWELSSSRAASVVHLFMENGLPPERMSVQGLSEYHPVADNSTAEGRNRNRRVVLVVLAGVDDHHVSELATHQTHAAAETAIPANSVAAATAIPSSSTP